MAKIQIVIADTDDIYVEHLARYLMENAEQCEVSTFSAKDSFLRYICSIHTDILLIDKGMLDSELNRADISVKILLSVDGSEENGYETVRKYQKTESILQEVLLKYAEATGNVDSLKGNRRTKIVAFYSPAGGSGKTTLALGTAAACAAAGMKAFYLNLEKIDSTALSLGRTAGNMSEVLLALKASGSDAGVKVMASRGQEPNTGFHYVSSADSILEYTELSGEEMIKLVEDIAGLDEYDVLIVDLASEFNREKSEILNKCNRIYVPVTEEESSVNKMQLLLHENTLHREYSGMMKKMRIISNKVTGMSGSPVLQSSGILNQIPMTAAISFSQTMCSIKNLLASAASMRNSFAPIVNEIRGL